MITAMMSTTMEATNKLCKYWSSCSEAETENSDDPRTSVAQSARLTKWSVTVLHKSMLKLLKRGNGRCHTEQASKRVMVCFRCSKGK